MPHPNTPAPAQPTGARSRPRPLRAAALTLAALAAPLALGPLAVASAPSASAAAVDSRSLPARPIPLTSEGGSPKPAGDSSSAVVIEGKGGEVLHLRWDGTTPVLESRDAKGRAVAVNTVQFRVPAIPVPAGDPDGDLNLLTMPEFDPQIDASWLARPGEVFPHAAFWGEGRKKRYVSVFEAPPAGIDPSSVRLRLRQYKGPSWFELNQFRPGYRFTERMLSNTHPYFRNYVFKGRFDQEPNWSFGAPGQYVISLAVTAETAGGEPVSSKVVTLTWDVTAGSKSAAPSPSPAPSSPSSPTTTEQPTPAPSASATPAPAPSGSAASAPTGSVPSKPVPSAAAPAVSGPSGTAPAAVAPSTLPPLQPSPAPVYPSLAELAPAGQGRTDSGASGLTSTAVPAGLPAVSEALPGGGAASGSTGGLTGDSAVPAGVPDESAADQSVAGDSVAGPADEAPAEATAAETESGAVVVDPATGQGLSGQNGAVQATGPRTSGSLTSADGGVSPWAYAGALVLALGAVALAALARAKKSLTEHS